MDAGRRSTVGREKETQVLCQPDAADGSCRNKSPAVAMAQRRSSCWTGLKPTVGLKEAIVLLLCSVTGVTKGNTMESNPCLPLVFFLIVSCSIAQIELAGMRQSEALGHRYRAKLEGNSNIDSALFQATEHVDISKFHHQEGLKEKDRIESFPGQPKVELNILKSPRLFFSGSMEVNVPKTRKACCKNKECKGHTLHKVTQYKKLGKLRWPCCSRKASADMIARSQARTTGQEEDCLEVAIPELQALVPTRSQAPVLLTACAITFWMICKILSIMMAKFEVHVLLVSSPVLQQYRMLYAMYLYV
ncbi:hypothetical protein NC652_020992 [Populus alba x Populus x berolinensis]|nr:hypothetical protein NC652_020992 [Populus alba x Populus x berolinensis]